MLAGGMLRPLLRRGNLRLVKHVGQLLPTKQSPLVDECAEIGGLGHVRRGGDDAVSQFVARFGEIEQYPPECRLRRLFGTIGRGNGGPRDSPRNPNGRAPGWEREVK